MEMIAGLLLVIGLLAVLFMRSGRSEPPTGMIPHAAAPPKDEKAE